MQAQLHASQIELLQTKLFAQKLATEKAELEKAALEARLVAEQHAHAQLAAQKQAEVNAGPSQVLSNRAASYSRAFKID